MSHSESPKMISLSSEVPANSDRPAANRADRAKIGSTPLADKLIAEIRAEVTEANAAVVRADATRKNIDASMAEFECRKLHTAVHPSNLPSKSCECAGKARELADSANIAAAIVESEAIRLQKEAKRLRRAWEMQTKGTGSKLMEVEEDVVGDSNGREVVTNLFSSGDKVKEAGNDFTSNDRTRSSFSLTVMSSEESASASSGSANASSTRRDTANNDSQKMDIDSESLTPQALSDKNSPPYFLHDLAGDRVVLDRKKLLAANATFLEECAKKKIAKKEKKANTETRGAKKKNVGRRKRRREKNKASSSESSTKKGPTYVAVAEEPDVYNCEEHPAKKRRENEEPAKVEEDPDALVLDDIEFSGGVPDLSQIFGGALDNTANTGENSLPNNDSSTNTNSNNTDTSSNSNNTNGSINDTNGIASNACGNDNAPQTPAASPAPDELRFHIDVVGDFALLALNEGKQKSNPIPSKRCLFFVVTETGVDLKKWINESQLLDGTVTVAVQKLNLDKSLLALVRPLELCAEGLPSYRGGSAEGFYRSPISCSDPSHSIMLLQSSSGKTFYDDDHGVRDSKRKMSGDSKKSFFEIHHDFRLDRSQAGVPREIRDPAQVVDRVARDLINEVQLPLGEGFSHMNKRGLVQTQSLESLITYHWGDGLKKWPRSEDWRLAAYYAGDVRALDIAPGTGCFVLGLIDMLDTIVDGICDDVIRWGGPQRPRWICFFKPGCPIYIAEQKYEEALTEYRASREQIKARFQKHRDEILDGLYTLVEILAHPSMIVDQFSFYFRIEEVPTLYQTPSQITEHGGFPDLSQLQLVEMYWYNDPKCSEQRREVLRRLIVAYCRVSEVNVQKILNFTAPSFGSYCHAGEFDHGECSLFAPENSTRLRKAQRLEKRKELDAKFVTPEALLNGDWWIYEQQKNQQRREEGLAVVKKYEAILEEELGKVQIAARRRLHKLKEQLENIDQVHSSKTTKSDSTKPLSHSEEISSSCSKNNQNDKEVVEERAIEKKRKIIEEQIQQLAEGLDEELDEAMMGSGVSEDGVSDVDFFRERLRKLNRREAGEKRRFKRRMALLRAIKAECGGGFGSSLGSSATGAVGVDSNVGPGEVEIEDESEGSDDGNLSELSDTPHWENETEDDGETDEDTEEETDEQTESEDDGEDEDDSEEDEDDEEDWKMSSSSSSSRMRKA